MRTPVLLTAILALLTLRIASGYALGNSICVHHPSDCEGEDCEKKQRCYNGKCTDHGECKCNPCWGGDSCDKYVDRYRPNFLERSVEIIIKPGTTGKVYQAKAEDDDLGMTCEFGPGDPATCPCATVLYEMIISSDTKNFYLDSETGVVYVGKTTKLEPGRKYKLQIMATGLPMNRSAEEKKEKNGADFMDLVVFVSYYDREPVPMNLPMDDFEDHLPYVQPYPLEEPLMDAFPMDMMEGHGDRVKRASAGTNADATKLILSVDGAPPATHFPGVEYSYDLIVHLPLIDSGSAMDLVVDIFTLDPESGEPGFAICSHTVHSVGANVKSNVTVLSVVGEEHMNELKPTMVDRVVFNFGAVYIDPLDDGSADAEYQILIKFAALMVLNEPTYAVGSNMYITAGAEYSDGTYVWVSQDTIVRENDPEAYDSAVTIEGSSEILIEDMELYTITMYLTYPTAALTVEVFDLDNIYPDHFSVGHVISGSLGANFACGPSDLSPYETQGFMLTGTERSDMRSVYSLKELIKKKGGDLTTDDNKVTFQVPVWVLHDAVEGTYFTLSAGLNIAGDQVWAGQLNVSTGARDAHTGETQSVLSDTYEVITPTDIPEGGVVTVQVKIRVEAQKYRSIILQATTTAPGIVCNIKRINWDKYIAYVRHDVDADVLIDTPTDIKKDYGRAKNFHSTDDAYAYFEVSFSMGVDPATSFTAEIWASGTQVYSGTINEGAAPTTNTSVIGSSADATGDDSFSNSTIHPFGQISFDMILEFPVHSMKTDLLVEILGDQDITDFDMKICRVELSFVGNGMPCLQAAMNDINANQVTFEKSIETRSYEDWASLNIGSLYVTDRGVMANVTDGQFVVNVVGQIPYQTGITATDFKAGGGLKLSSTEIFACSLTYNVDPTRFNTYHVFSGDSILPYMVAYTDGVSSHRVGQLGYGHVILKLPPSTRGVYTIKVRSLDPTLYPIARMKIVYVGHNYPCLDRHPDAWLQDDEDSYLRYTDDRSYGILRLGYITNIGNEPLTAMKSPDANSIIVAFFHEILTGAPSSMPFSVYLDYNGDDTNDLTSSVSTVLDSTAIPTTPEITVHSIAARDASSVIQEVVPKILAVTMTIAAGFHDTDLKVTFTNPDAGTKDFVIANAIVTSTGINIPGVNGSNVVIERTNPQTVGEIEYFGDITLSVGKVSHVNYDPDETTEMVVEVAVMVPASSGFSNIQVNYAVTGADITGSPSGNFPMTVDATVFTPPSVENGSVSISLKYDDGVDGDLTDVDVMEAEIGEKVWIPFSVEIPEDTTVNLKVSSLTPSTDDRAIMTMHGVRWHPETGKNVVPLQVVEAYSPTYTSPITFNHKSQKDAVTLDLGFFTTAAFTDKQYHRMPDDNKLTLEVEVQMTDHPDNAVANKINYVQVGADYGDFIAIHSQPVQVKRKAVREDEKANIRPYLYLTDNTTTLYEQGEHVGLNMLVKHEPDSAGEGLTSTVRFFLPRHMEYVEGSDTMYSNCSVNATTHTLGFLELEMAEFFFTDICEFNLTVTVDPELRRAPGSGTVGATTLARVLCTQTPFDLWPNSDTTLLYCGGLNHVDYETNSAECYDPLGMESGLVTNCQITASSARDKDSLQGARLNSADNPWIPAYMDGMPQWIQFDFGNKTRITKIHISKETGYRYVTKVQVQYSFHHIGFKDGDILTFTDAQREVELVNKIKTRYLRLVVLESDGAQPETNMELAARFEFNGCPVTSDVGSDAVCQYPDKTRYGDNVKTWRHFVVNQENNAIFFCDYISNKDEWSCFSSLDGSTWKALPTYIGYFVGYNAAPDKQYVLAYDKKERSLMKTVDGSAMIIIAKDDVAAELADVNIVESTVIPGLLPGNIPPVISGGWTADGIGLQLGGAYKVKWSSCCN